MHQDEGIYARIATLRSYPNNMAHFNALTDYATSLVGETQKRVIAQCLSWQHTDSYNLRVTSQTAHDVHLDVVKSVGNTVHRIIYMYEEHPHQLDLVSTRPALSSYVEKQLSTELGGGMPLSLKLHPFGFVLAKVNVGAKETNPESVYTLVQSSFY